MLRNPLRLVDPEGDQFDIIENTLSIYQWYKSERSQADYYQGLSLVGKEEYKKSQADYSTGRIESAEIQPADFIAAPLGVVLANKLPLFGKTALTFGGSELIETANQITKSITTGETTTKEVGNAIAKSIGKSRISVGYGELNLVGKPHFSKSLQDYIETPHLKPIIFNYAPGKGFIPKANENLTRPANMEDLERAWKIIKNNF